MAVQDDEREVEMREIIGLRRGDGRSGIDAYMDFTARDRPYSVPIELKSTTVGTVSTTRDVSRDHIEKWRSRVWVFGFYGSGGSVLESWLALGPDDMAPWISRIEGYMAPDLMIGDRIAPRLEMDDLHVICGEKDTYALGDAKALYKRQWTEDEYSANMDLPNGYSPTRMLEILRLRAHYLIDRGSTLNNPHIPKRFFSTFADRQVPAAVVNDGLRRHIRRAIRQTTLASTHLRRLSAALGTTPSRAAP